MEDGKILKKMMHQTKGAKRTEQVLEIGGGLIDDFADPNAATNKFYHKWIRLVKQHQEGELVLTGLFRYASAFVAYASQFSEANIPTNILKGRDTNDYNTKTVSFIPPVLHRAILGDNKGVMSDYLAGNGSWDLDLQEQTMVRLLAS